MDRKYANLAKEIPIHGRNGNIKLGAVLEEDFFGWDSFSLRYCLVDDVGMIPEELTSQHTHDYDQILLFVSAEPADLLNLGAEVEVDLGPENVRHLIAIPHGVAVPKGLPHFSPVVRRLDRPFFFISVNCTGKLAAAAADPNAVSTKIADAKRLSVPIQSLDLWLGSVKSFIPKQEEPDKSDQMTFDF